MTDLKVEEEVEVVETPNADSAIKVYRITGAPLTFIVSIFQVKFREVLKVLRNFNTLKVFAVGTEEELLPLRKALANFDLEWTPVPIKEAEEILGIEIDYTEIEVVLEDGSEFEVILDEEITEDTVEEEPTAE